MSSNYYTLNNAYFITEKFFVSYALNGAIVNPEQGLRQGMPSLYPLKNSPVVEPSPLNTRYKYIPKFKYNLVGIL
jgi:hypothetical protein